VTAPPARCVACGAAAEARFRAGGVEIQRCAGCGLAWRTAFPEAAELAALYGDDYFERWGVDTPDRLAQVRAMKQATYRAFFRDIRAQRDGGRLLDLGCALGFLLGVARDFGFDVRGLDLNPAAIAEAQREFGDRVHAGPLDERAFPGERFDVVTLIDVLEHVPDPAGLLAAIAARLAPGGIAAAVLPNTGSLACRVLGRRWPHYNAEHLYYWSAASLRRFLERDGWRVLALRQGVRKTFTAHYLDRYARRLGRTLVPGLGALGGLRLRIPTGEMLVIAAPPANTGERRAGGGLRP
jgi:2-polyprenyl-3-methyl-5-hydroxy-6-metoxy-1,4-benzoquinol methylase